MVQIRKTLSIPIVMILLGILNSEEFRRKCLLSFDYPQIFEPQFCERLANRKKNTTTSVQTALDLPRKTPCICSTEWSWDCTRWLSPPDASHSHMSLSPFPSCPSIGFMDGKPVRNFTFKLFYWCWIFQISILPSLGTSNQFKAVRPCCPTWQHFHHLELRQRLVMRRQSRELLEADLALNLSGWSLVLCPPTRKVLGVVMNSRIAGVSTSQIASNIALAGGHLSLGAVWFLMIFVWEMFDKAVYQKWFV